MSSSPTGAALFAAPGLDDAQKKALIALVDGMVKSDAWKKMLGGQELDGPLSLRAMSLRQVAQAPRMRASPKF